MLAPALFGSQAPLTPLRHCTLQGLDLWGFVRTVACLDATSFECSKSPFVGKGQTTTFV